MNTSSEAPRIDEVLVVINPNSSKGEHARSQMSDLFGSDGVWAGTPKFLETVTPNNGNNVDLIRAALQPNQVVFGCGGDGLANDITNSLATSDPEVRDSNFFVPMPFGNVSDSAISINGKEIKDPKTWAKLLSEGQATDLNIILTELNDKEQRDVPKQRRYALGYVGLGYTALGSQFLNVPAHRQRKTKPYMPGKLLDGIQLSRAFLHRKDQAFKYTENGQPSAEMTQEMLFMAQERMAGGLVKINTDTLHGLLICIEIAESDFLRGMIRNVMESHVGGIEDRLTHGRTITVDTPTVIHYDGEPYEVKENSELSVVVAQKHIKTLTLPQAA